MPGEFERLREAASEMSCWYLWPVVELAIETAMRKGELLSLKWCYIDFEKSVALLPQTKNGSPRWVPLSPPDTVSGEFLFPQYIDGISTNANSASAALNKWMKTFLPKECVVHGMRHAFRDRLRAVNAPTDLIDQLGGWSLQSVGQGYGDGYDLDMLYSHTVCLEL